MADTTGKAKSIPPIAPEGTDLPGTSSEPLNTVEVLSRLDALERDQKHLAKLVNFVQGTNNLVIIVLFVGFLTLLVGLVTLMVDAIKGNSADHQTVIEQQVAPTPSTTLTPSPSGSPH